MRAEKTLTILMPCLNEEESIAFCVREAQRYIEASQMEAEILIVDNGSTDRSAQIARELGARVVTEEKRGYGNAVRAGIREAQGKYIIMGDSDGSYDFCSLSSFIEMLEAGYSLVVGNRLCREMEMGAMPFLHRYLGVPFLSWLARNRFGIKEVQDFHCGQRGFCRETAQGLPFRTGGMEFATEMIVEFAMAGVRICEVPVAFRRDKRSGLSHLRTFRDGWRHLKYIMTKEYKKTASTS